MQAVTVLVLAHAAPGFDAVGLSPGLVLYLTAAGVALATLPCGRGRSAGWTAVDRRGPVAGRRAARRRAGRAGRPRGRRPRGHARLRAGSAATSSATTRSPSRSSACSGSAGSCSSALLGDVWRLVDPFDHLAGLLLAAVARRGPGPTCGGSPHCCWRRSVGRGWPGPTGCGPARSGGGWPAYTAVMVVGALVGGRAWVRRHEAFGVAFGLLALVQPDRLDRPAAPPAQPADGARLAGRSTGVRARCSRSLVGIALFDAVSYTQWWADFLGVRSLGGYTAFNTLGLVWLIATAAVVWIAVARVAGVVAGEPVGARTAVGRAGRGAGRRVRHGARDRVAAERPAGVRPPGHRPAVPRAGTCSGTGELAGRDGGVADRPGLALAGAAGGGRVRRPSPGSTGGRSPASEPLRAPAPSGSSPPSSSPRP